MTTTLHTPEKIADRYRIEAVLGQGGMGTVYQGLDTFTQTPVAIKALKPDILQFEPDLVARFQREGEMLRQLNHPNIVAMLNAVTQDGIPYLIMELVTGGSLADLLHRQSPLPLSQVLPIALDLADALTRTHRLKIIHRDLKPANVLIAKDGTPRLTDFGVAHSSAAPVTGIGQVVGTLHYISPEALESKPLDARADIWAFGVLLYEMVAGKRPFDGDTLHSTIRAILTQQPPDLEELRPNTPIALIDLIYRMLEKNRDARIPSVRLVGAELEAILQGSTTFGDSRFSKVVLEDEATFRFNTTTTPTGQIRHNLPTPPTPFVGREDEIQELIALLEKGETRLATILAPGGMGKTRLSIEVARHFVQSGNDATQAHLNNRYNSPHLYCEHGVYFVALAPLPAHEDILPTLAEALNFTIAEEKRSPRQQVIDYLREKHMLLIFDNFEHVLNSADLLAEMIEAAPHVKMLVTSRERLALRAETLYPIGGMDFPEFETPEQLESLAAVKLFMQSAKRANPAFELTAENRLYLARICRQVQGMPLGIELAAAWVETLSLPEISEEINRSLDFLETDMRDVPERQRSIRAVFEYSWALLDEEERRVMQALAVFHGTFSREAAQKITGASLRTLTNLVNKSLLRRNLSGRYEVHELLRQYAESILKDSTAIEAAIRDKHTEYYVELVYKLESDLKSDKQIQAMHTIDPEIENVKAANLWAAQRGNTMMVGKSMFALYIFLFSCNRIQEGQHLYDQMLKLWEQHNPDNDLVYMFLRIHRTMMAAWGPITEDYHVVYEETKHLLESPLPAHIPHLKIGYIYFMMGEISFEVGKVDDAQHLMEKARQTFEEVGDLWWLSQTLMMQSGITALSGNYERGIEQGTRAYKIAKQIKNPLAIAGRSNIMGQMSFYSGKYEEAYAYFAEGLPYSEQIGHTANNAAHHWWMGRTSLEQGNWDKAYRHLQNSLTIYTDNGDRGGAAGVYNALGILALKQEQWDTAKHYLDQALNIQRAIANFSEMPQELSNLAWWALETGHTSEAKRYILEGLRYARGGLGGFMRVELLLRLGQVITAQQDYTYAAEILGLIKHQPISISLEQIYFAMHDEVVAQLSPQDFQAAFQRGAGYNIEDFIQQTLSQG